MLEAAALGASIRHFRELARAAGCGAFTQRQGRRVLRQKTMALEELRGSAGAEARSNLDRTESPTFFGARRRWMRAGGCRATREVPIGRARQNHERADQREEHAAVLPGESSIRLTLMQASGRTR